MTDVEIPIQNDATRRVLSYAAWRSITASGGGEQLDETWANIIWDITGTPSLGESRETEHEAFAALIAHFEAGRTMFERVLSAPIGHVVTMDRAVVIAGLRECINDVAECLARGEGREADLDAARQLVQDVRDE